MPPKGFMYIFHLIGRKLFKKRQANEVEYGQTLSRKRRRNCVLKSVSTLSDEGPPEIGDWIEAPYKIKFEFSSDDRDFRGSVLNFQKIDLSEKCCLNNCCDKNCFCSTDAKSLSSDSACDLTSGSSCEEPDCSHVETRKSSAGRTSVEDFIRIHNEHFMKKWESEVTEEPNYETLAKTAGSKSECNYDILLSRSKCNVMEPSYENLKLVENLYETPKNIDLSSAIVKRCSDDCSVKKIKDLVQANKPYDEVIESLKVLHSSSEPEKLDSCECDAEDGDNDINDYLENFKSYENDVSNDVESVSFQY